MHRQSYPYSVTRHLLFVFLCGGMSLSAFAQDDAEPVVISGEVKDIAGLPVSGVPLFLAARETAQWEQIAVTEDDGTFRVTVPKEVDLRRHDLLARTDEFMGVKYAGAFVVRRGKRDEDAVIPLSRMTTLTGRVLETSGLPAAGVEVRALRVWQFAERTLADAIANRGEPIPFDDISFRASGRLRAPVEPNDILPVVTSDAEGRFELPSLPAGAMVELLIRGSRAEATLVHVRTDEGPEMEIPVSLANPNLPPERLLVSGFELTVQPSVPLIGRVFSLRENRPVTGAEIQVFIPARAGSSDHLDHYLRTKTLGNGRFSLTGLPTKKMRLSAVPPVGEPALIPVERSVEMDSEDPVVNTEFGLPTGLVASGRVLDRRTRVPLDGTVRYFALADNAHSKSLKAGSLSGDALSSAVDDEGRYSIPVLPGPGVLTFFANGEISDQYPRGQGADEIPQEPEIIGGGSKLYRAEPYYITPFNYHKMLPIDPSAEDKALNIDLELDGPAKQVTIRFVNQTDEPLGGIYYLGSSADGGPFQLAERSGGGFVGVVRFFESGLNQRRMVQVRDRDHRASGWAFVTADQDEVSIDVHPAAEITGRIVDAEGTPVVGAELSNDFNNDASAKIGELPANPETYAYRYWTDKEGRFRFVGLPAGLPLSVRVSTDDEKGRNILRGLIFKDLELELSETRDLGDIRMDRLIPLR